jgi:hypothetical protein
MTAKYFQESEVRQSTKSVQEVQEAVLTTASSSGMGSQVFVFRGMYGLRTALTPRGSAALRSCQAFRISSFSRIDQCSFSCLQG